MWSEIEGDIENEGGVLAIKRVRMVYHIKVPKGKRPQVDHAVATHEQKCPAANSVRGCIKIDCTAKITEE